MAANDTVNFNTGFN